MERLELLNEALHKDTLNNSKQEDRECRSAGPCFGQRHHPFSSHFSHCLGRQLFLLAKLADEITCQSYNGNRRVLEVSYSCKLPLPKRPKLEQPNSSVRHRTCAWLKDVEATHVFGFGIAGTPRAFVMQLTHLGGFNNRNLFFSIIVDSLEETATSGTTCKALTGVPSTAVDRGKTSRTAPWWWRELHIKRFLAV